jgi:hypothetical protein
MAGDVHALKLPNFGSLRLERKIQSERNKKKQSERNECEKMSYDQHYQCQDCERKQNKLSPIVFVQIKLKLQVKPINFYNS